MKFQIPWKSLLGSVLVVALLALLFAFFIDWQTVARQLKQVTLLSLAFASLLLILGYIAYAIRWRLLLKNIPDFSPTFHAANAGNMANTLLPLRPGDAARIFVLGSGESIPLLQVTSSIVVERWFEQIMRLASFGGAIVFGAGSAVSSGTILGSIAFLSASLLMMIWMIQRQEFVLRKFPSWLARIPRLSEEQARQGLANLINGLAGVASIRDLALVLCWSVVAWTFFWGFHYLCLLGFASKEA